MGTAITTETETPERYGVDDPLPDTFSAQMLAPFLRDKTGEAPDQAVAEQADFEHLPGEPT